MENKCARPECDNELKHIEGRKKKKYCSRECKLRHWQQLNPVKKDKKYVRVPIEEWELLKQGVSQPIKEVKNTAPNTITTPKEALVEVKIPKNLQELKDMCPIKSGIDRNIWIETERVKYNF